MRRAIRTISLTIAVLCVAAAQGVAQQKPAGLVGDLLADVEDVESKLVGLADAIPADKYDWRPAEGVRSTSEVFLHSAADNYLIPAMAGVQAPEGTGVTAEYASAQAFEQREMDRDATIEELKRSLTHLKDAISSTSEADLAREIDMFGQKATVQKMWVLATGHLHEHLGQMIAYARSSGIVPPWSR